MTSNGVLPKTLAAPAVAPNAAVINGFTFLWGLSPDEAHIGDKAIRPYTSTKFLKALAFVLNLEYIFS